MRRVRVTHLSSGADGCAFDDFSLRYGTLRYDLVWSGLVWSCGATTTETRDTRHEARDKICMHVYTGSAFVLCKHLGLSLQVYERLLVMAWDDLTPCCSLQLLQTLRALEPGWVVSGQPALWDAVSPLWMLLALLGG